MKKFYSVFLFFTSFSAFAQITTPIVKANFGVDADLRANYFNSFAQSGNDDWFTNSAGSGEFVIDTTGAAAILAAYTSNPATREIPFFRTMRYPAYTIVNNRMLIDAVFIRDYHGDDSTIFASGGNKNGDSPANWSCPISQSVPDKNEILDMMVHVRRAGPNATDSLWMFGGISIENTSGSRYVDFEMYQTDIYYDRGPRAFFGYGPNAGHTIWQFNSAGDITVPGDVIFTAEFNTGLNLVEARIWVDKASLLMTPIDFNWTGTFDGAASGSQYGYAGIKPKTTGAFYTGLTCANNTWAGPFKVVLGNNTVNTNYTSTQFMEFSVNLTKLGLDPVTLLGGNSCGMPFRRVLVKSRASNSFTAALKDFVGPFDFFLTPKVSAYADIPVFCGVYGVSNLQVSNAVSTSVYEWSTPDGHIITSPATGTSVYVDSPGTYIVSHKLQASCPVYATDTIVVPYEPMCFVLENNFISLSGIQKKQEAELKWNVINTDSIRYFQVERSTDGMHFQLAGKQLPAIKKNDSGGYSFMDNIAFVNSPRLFYRVKMVTAGGKGSYSRIIKLSITAKGLAEITISPNPIKNKLNVQLTTAKDETVSILIYDLTGKLIRSAMQDVQSGQSAISLTNLDDIQSGVYMVKVMMGDNVYVKKVVFSK